MDTINSKDLEKMDMRSKNLNHIKKRLTIISVLEDLLIWINNNGDEKLSLHPVIENAVIELFNIRNPRLSSDIENEVKEELISAIYTKINMIQESLLPYIRT